MHQQLQRYAAAAAGAAFVVVWTTLGTTTAIAAVVVAAAAAHLPRLVAAQRHRRSEPSPRRRPVHARPLREEREDLPLVPDDPSLVLSSSTY